MIRVLIADDQPLILEGFKALLDREPDITVVAEAADGADAVVKVRDMHPDVAVLDVRMPVMDGVEAARRIMRGPGPPKVLMLTTFDLDEYVYDALRAGASGFLLKDVSRHDLVLGVRDVAAGEALLAPAITRRLVERFVRQPRARAIGVHQTCGLTGREVEVLRLLAHGMTNREIGESLFLSPATVKTHVAHLLDKLSLRDRVHAVVYAYETGLVEPGDFSDI
jgi:DNA-binding NarL/FixJ family response regulator